MTDENENNYADKPTTTEEAAKANPLGEATDPAAAAQAPKVTERPVSESPEAQESEARSESAT